jgi:hypothetical protein
MPRERTIKGPAKRGTITKRQARTAAREILEERYGKANNYETAGKAAKKSPQSGKQQTASTTNKRGSST